MKIQRVGRPDHQYAEIAQDGTILTITLGELEKTINLSEYYTGGRLELNVYIEDDEIKVARFLKKPVFTIVLIKAKASPSEFLIERLVDVFVIGFKQ